MGSKYQSSNVPILGVDGRKVTVNGKLVTVLMIGPDSKILWATGPDLPTEDDTEYAVGALFIRSGDEDAGLYVNTGTSGEPDFSAFSGGGGSSPV